jgi:hypothetical protein
LWNSFAFIVKASTARKIFQALVDVGPGVTKFVMKGKRK